MLQFTPTQHNNKKRKKIKVEMKNAYHIISKKYNQF
jgi:hypothetical protein